MLSFFDESKGDFREGSPDSSGFAESQIRFLKEQISDAKGGVIVAFHAPLINIKGNTPPHLMRETEHQNLSNQQETELWLELFNRGMLSMVSFTPNGDGCLPAGWSLKAHNWFKKGSRDPYLSKGVVDHRSQEFLDAVTGEQPRHDHPVLCLSGHTHRSIEYIVRRAGDEIRYYYDQYLDGTQHGKCVKPAYADALSTHKGHSRATTDWWRRHTPMFVQTLSLGPLPPEESPGSC